VPDAASAGLAFVLDVLRLPPELTTILEQTLHLPLVSYYLGVVDIGDICRENADPPPALDQLAVSIMSDYISKGPVLGTVNALAYIRSYLRYQLFLQHCVCNAFVPPAGLDCFHGVNVVVPQPLNSTVSLGTVTIAPETFEVFRKLDPTLHTIIFTAALTLQAGDTLTHSWDLEMQLTDGTWVGVVAESAFGVGTPIRRQASFGSTLPPITPNAPLRIRNVAARGHTYPTLDFCFDQGAQVPPALPVQPPLPNLPTIPPPVCDTTDLCSIVLELARSLTRVASQVSDIQAAVTGTDELVTLGSQTIFGEGALPIVVGTRAVSIELTSLGPGVFTSALGNPRGLMRAGSIRWGDGTGFSKRQFIDAEDFTRLRPQGSITINWQLINECVGVLRFLG
jgi:hypothetical protein